MYTSLYTDPLKIFSVDVKSMLGSGAVEHGSVCCVWGVGRGRGEESSR